MSVAADIDVYFCDPHSPWQRATNENTNGLLRQYFPNATAIGTLVERTTGYTMLMHLPDGYKAERVRDALTEKIKTIPGILRASHLGSGNRDARLATGQCRRGHRHLLL